MSDSDYSYSSSQSKTHSDSSSTVQSNTDSHRTRSSITAETCPSLEVGSFDSKESGKNTSATTDNKETPKESSTDKHQKTTKSKKQKKGAKSKEDTESPGEIKKATRIKDTAMVSFTFINCCIGAGLLALPKIFLVTGYIMTAVYVVASAVYCFWVFSILSTATYHGNFSSLREMASKLWGKAYGIVIDVSMMFCNMGFLCSYVSISSDYIREGIATLAKVPLLQEDLWKKLFKIFVAVGVVFPLTLLKTVNAISYISSFAILFTLVAFIAVNVRFFQYVATGVVNGVERGPVVANILPEKTGWPATIAYFTTFFALYTIHASMIPIQREMNGSASYRRKTVTRSSFISLVVVLVICVIIGVEGSLMFDRNCSLVPPEVRKCVPINSNILLAFVEDMAMIIIRLLYAVVTLVSFPCMLYPVRTSICEWFKIDKTGGRAKYPHMTKEARMKLPIQVRNGYGFYVLAGLIVIFIVTLLAVFVPEIDKILSITSNIFGLILYEIHAVFIWFKLPKCKDISIGRLLDTKLVTPEGEQRKSTGRRMSMIGSDDKENPIKGISMAHRATIGAIDEKKRYSYVFEGQGDVGAIVENRKAPIVGDDIEKLKSELDQAIGGSRVWGDGGDRGDGGDGGDNNHNAEESESIPTLEDGHTTPTLKTREPNSEVIDVMENELNNCVHDAIKGSVRKVSFMQSRAMSIVEGGGEEEVVFPNISKEKFPLKGKRFGVFIGLTVFFTAFNISAIVCDILGWVK